MASYSLSSNGFRTGSKTPVSILQELLLRNNIVPHYELIHNGVGTHDPQFKYKLEAGGFTAIGSGKSKKEAKHDAARSVLKKMHYNKALTESVHVEPAEEIDIESPYSGAVKENVVGQLTDLCIVNNLPPPEYIPVREEGPPHARLFTYECRLSTRSETSIARTKKQAKHMVSQQMINRLSDILGDKMVLVPEKIFDPDTDEPDLTPLLMLEGVKKNQLNLGLKISQYHELLTDDDSTDFEPIPILEDLKKRNLTWILNHPSPEDLLKEIMSQLHCTYDIKSVSKSDFDEITEEDLANLSDVSENDECSTNFTEERITNVEEYEKVKNNSQKSNQELLNDSKDDECSTNFTEGRITNVVENEKRINNTKKPNQELLNDSNSNTKLSTVIIRIESSSPPRVFFGYGNCHADAVRSATVNALTFYFYMPQSNPKIKYNYNSE